MRTTLEPPRTLEVPEQRPLIKEAKLPPAAKDLYAKPRRRWPARHKLLFGMGVLVIAGGVGVGVFTQGGGGDTAVTVGAGIAGSANSAEHRAELTLPGVGSAGSANSAEHRAELTLPGGGSAGSANSAEHRAVVGED